MQSVGQIRQSTCYSPDAIAFENYQLINIYNVENAFFNEYGYERPFMRETSGEPMLSLRNFIQYENVLGSSNTYLNSGGQFSVHAALFRPKGDKTTKWQRSQFSFQGWRTNAVHFPRVSPAVIVVQPFQGLEQLTDFEE